MRRGIWTRVRFAALLPRRDRGGHYTIQCRLQLTVSIRPGWPTGANLRDGGHVAQHGLSRFAIATRVDGFVEVVWRVGKASLL